MTGISNETLSMLFDNMLQSPLITVGFMAIIVVLGFLILSFGVEKGVERVTKLYDDCTSGAYGGAGG